jgi:hypothetical protein
MVDEKQDSAIHNLTVEFTIPISVLRQLETKDKWSGKLSACVNRITPKQAEISKHIKQKEARALWQDDPEVKSIVEYWNQHPYIVSVNEVRNNEDRNHKIFPREVLKNLRIFRRIIKKFSVDEIK